MLKYRREVLTKKFLSRQAGYRDSMLIPKLRLLVERIQNRRECPLYMKPYLFLMWQDIKENRDFINKLDKSSCYNIDYKNLYLDISIDLGSRSLIKNSDPNRGLS